MKIIVYCPNCKHKISKMGFNQHMLLLHHPNLTDDGAGIYRCSDCGIKWIIKEVKEEE